MPTSIHKRVRAANAGENPNAIIKLKSGWVVAGDTQPLHGYCLLLSDPVAPNLNSLSVDQRVQYCLDYTRIGDAILKATEAYHINYETLGNLDPALHTHVIPRYRSEPDAKRVAPPMMAYDWGGSPKFDPVAQKAFIEKMRELLRPYA